MDRLAKLACRSKQILVWFEINNDVLKFSFKKVFKNHYLVITRCFATRKQKYSGSYSIDMKINFIDLGARDQDLVGSFLRLPLTTFLSIPWSLI